MKTATISGAAVQASDRNPTYYECSRPEVRALVPDHCHRILEVGCAAGQLGRALKEQGHYVAGVELVPDVAEEAARWLDEVITADVETDGFPFPHHSFDAIIFADVLEHLVDPWRVLREATDVLTEEGVIIASIPNVQNFRVLRQLIRGDWRYTERGLLDRGHLRFFTLKSIQRLFDQAGLTITQVERVYRRKWWRRMLNFLTAGRSQGFFANQYLLVAQRRIPRR